jgi:pantetheine-phosphate adenylyltransferase
MGKQKRRKGVYAGSFDPITEGHMHMVRVGSRLFDEFVVAVGMNPAKAYTFSLEERRAFVESAVRGIDNVKVVHFANRFLVDFAREMGADYILRGIRNEHDYAFERQMRHVNADIAPEINTIFLMPPREIAEVSSSFVKSLVGPEGWREVVRAYLPPQIYESFCRHYGGRTPTPSSPAEDESVAP